VAFILLHAAHHEQCIHYTLPYFFVVKRALATHLPTKDVSLMNRMDAGCVESQIEAAWRTLQGYEAMNMLRKGQTQGVPKRDSLSQATFIAALFGVAI